MKIEILVICITIFFIFNAYYDNMYIDFLVSWKKYYQIAIIAFFGFSFYIFVRKNPNSTKGLIATANELIKGMPVDKNINPVNLDKLFINKSAVPKGAVPQGTVPETYTSPLVSPLVPDQSTRRIMSSGGNNSSKRCVSESKKKYVASNQKWRCAMCDVLLDSCFEIDHIQSLHKGGTNHISNLRALCRNCHGRKTAMENF